MRGRLSLPGLRTPFAAALLMVGVVVATSLAGPWDGELRSSSAPLDGPVERAPAPEVREPAEPRSWEFPWPDVFGLLVVMVVGLLLAVLALLVVLAMRHLQRPERGTDDEVDALDDGRDDVRVAAMRAGVEQGEQAVRIAGEPRDAVVAAWVAVETAAAECGVERAPSSTPTEFALSVLDRTPADPVVARELLALYLRARFGDEPVTDVDVESALACLGALRRTLTAAPAAAASS